MKIYIDGAFGVTLEGISRDSTLTAARAHNPLPAFLSKKGEVVFCLPNSTRDPIDTDGEDYNKIGSILGEDGRVDLKTKDMS